MHPAREGRLREGTPESGAGAVPGRRTDTVRCRAAFASARPAQCRTARCSLHWRRRGSSRLHPVVPGSAGSGRTGGQSLTETAVGRRKASAPVPRGPGGPGSLPLKRERTEPRRAPHRKMRVPARCVSRCPASLFFRGCRPGMAWQNPDAPAARERAGLRVLPFRHLEAPAQRAGLDRWRLHRRAAVPLRGSACGRAPLGDGREVCGSDGLPPRYRGAR